MNLDGPIEGVLIRQLTRHEDDRGWLIECYRQDELPAEWHPAMSYVSMTKPSTVRGPHEHAEQADFFCFLGPSTFRLYLWDNRRDSPTFGKHFQLDVGEKLQVAVLVPPGIVHAYKNIGTVDGVVYNAPNRLYGGAGRTSPVDEVRHEDDPNSAFQIDSDAAAQASDRS